jgi:arginine decarboxylase
MKRIAFIGDKDYVDLLLNHSDKPGDIELKHFNRSEEIFKKDTPFMPDCVLIMTTTKDSLLDRYNYYGLREVFPTLRLFFNYNGPVVLLGFENFDVAKTKFHLDFIDPVKGMGDQYQQLPLSWEILSGKINVTPGEVEKKNYIPFCKSKGSGYLKNLKHKYSNSHDPRIARIIDFLEGRSNEVNNSFDDKLPNEKKNNSNGFLPKVKLLIVDDSEYILDCIFTAFQAELPLYEEKLGINIELLRTPYSLNTGFYKGVFSKEKDYNFNEPGWLEEDGDIQAVLLDWQLELPGHEGTETSYQDCIKQRLVHRIQDFRPDIHIYTMTAFSESAVEIANMQENVNSFFFKEEILQDPRSILDRIFLKNLANKMHAPFWDAYHQYIEKATDTWHPPGHSRGKGFNSSPYLRPFYNYWGREVFTGDLSFGVKDIGFLDESSGSIKKAQKVAAETFGADYTFFITNGTSTSNKVVMQSLLKPGDKVIIDQNCHKSNHYGFLLADAVPVYLPALYIKSLSLFMPPKIEDIKNTLQANLDAKVLLLTGSSYEGVVIDTKSIVEAVKKIVPDIKVFIDEAWFAYSAFHPHMRRYSAISNGADYVTHSSHKVLSSFSQSSVIHIKDKNFSDNEDFFKDIYQAYLSTSPQYQIIASLDICSMQMRMEGFKILQNLINLATQFSEQITNWKPSKIKVVDERVFEELYPEWTNENLYKDPLKVLLDIRGLESTTESICNHLNEKVGLEIERRTRNTILVIFSIGTDKSMVYRLLGSLKKLNDGIEKLPKNISSDGILTYPPIIPKISPREAFYAKRKKIPIEKAEGEISSTLITPYPPGIPLLVFGQEITEDHIKIIQDLKEDPNIKDVHGIKKENGKQYIYIVDRH